MSDELNVTQPEVTENSNLETQNTEITSAENTTQAEVKSEPFLRVKYNKEEIELDRDKAIEYTQKGLNYDKIHEKLSKLEADPRIGFVDRMASKFGMTPEQYLDAVKREEEQAEINQLIQQNIPEELAQEIYESRKFRDDYQKMQTKSQEDSRRQQQYADFLEAFPDVKPDTIPEQVWQMFNQGTSLVDAYTRWDYNNLKTQVKANETNQKNQSASTGTVTGQGSPEHGEFFTIEQLKTMSEADMIRHYDKAIKSYEHWAKNQRR
jgi:hypothetical protein